MDSQTLRKDAKHLSCTLFVPVSSPTAIRSRSFRIVNISGIVDLPEVGDKVASVRDRPGRYRLAEHHSRDVRWGDPARLVVPPVTLVPSSRDFFDFGRLLPGLSFPAGLYDVRSAASTSADHHRAPLATRREARPIYGNLCGSLRWLYCGGGLYSQCHGSTFYG